MILQADDPQVEIVDKKTTNTEKTPPEKPKERKLKIWGKITYPQPKQAIPGDFYYTSAKSLTEINCTARTRKSLQKIYYDADGNEIKSIHYGVGEKSEAVVPDTPSEILFNFACAFSTTKASAKPRATPSTQAQPKKSAEKNQPRKESTKEAQPKAAANAKPSPKPSSTAPTTKATDLKKTTK